MNNENILGSYTWHNNFNWKEYGDSVEIGLYKLRKQCSFYYKISSKRKMSLSRIIQIRQFGWQSQFKLEESFLIYLWSTRDKGTEENVDPWTLFFPLRDGICRCWCNLRDWDSWKLAEMFPVNFEWVQSFEWSVTKENFLRESLKTLNLKDVLRSYYWIPAIYNRRQRNVYFSATGVLEFCI